MKAVNPVDLFLASKKCSEGHLKMSFAKAPFPLV
jgi:hypothetical protein